MNLADLVKSSAVANKSLTLILVNGKVETSVKTAEAADTIVVNACLEVKGNAKARFIISAADRDYALRVATSASREYGDLAKVYKKVLTKEEYFAGCAVLLDPLRTSVIIKDEEAKK